MTREVKGLPHGYNTPFYCMNEKSNVKSGCVSRLHLPHSCGDQQSCVHASLTAYVANKW